jgi:hypothetical protein
MDAIDGVNVQCSTVRNLHIACNTPIEAYVATERLDHFDPLVKYTMGDTELGVVALGTPFDPVVGPFTRKRGPNGRKGIG